MVTAQRMLVPTAGSPAARGYRMPPEWAPHAATWLSWPHKEESWPGKLAQVEQVWVTMVRNLAAGEKVHVLVNEAAPAAHVRSLLEEGAVALEQVVLHEVPTDDAWIRDSGPIFVTRESDTGAEIALVDWMYNAWGGKYPPWDLDDRIPAEIARILAVPRFAPGIVLEGGSVDVNGAGTLLTTEACLLHPNRNAGLTRADIEQLLCDYLAVRNVLWLGQGICGDDTDGHVDDLARFVSADTILTVIEDDPTDENYALLQDNRNRLAKMRDQDGAPLRVVTLPMPRPVHYDGTRLPASYANFYIGNAVVLVPVFGDPRDRQALDTLQALFPGRRVVGINAVDLVWGLGAFHCVSQQQPSIS